MVEEAIVADGPSSDDMGSGGGSDGASVAAGQNSDAIDGGCAGSMARSDEVALAVAVVGDEDDIIGVAAMDEDAERGGEVGEGTGKRSLLAAEAEPRL